MYNKWRMHIPCLWGGVLLCGAGWRVWERRGLQATWRYEALSTILLVCLFSVSTLDGPVWADLASVCMV